MVPAQRAELGVAPLVKDPTRPSGPSWARHVMQVDPHPSAPILVLIDGFASCLAGVIPGATTGAPTRPQAPHRLLPDAPLP